MNRFVRSANLPEQADILLIGEKYADILNNGLHKLHISTIFVPNNPNIDTRLSGHADLSVLHVGGEGIFLAPYLKGSELEEKLTALGAENFFPQLVQNDTYPNDAQFNICLAGKTAFCNRETSSSTIVNYLTNVEGFTGVYGRQGYARCSMCVVQHNALITSDPGLYKAAVNCGFDVLKIAPGGIELPGFQYGFIGGATFKLAADTLAFTGVLDQLQDRDRILAFLEAHNVKPVYITDIPLFDIGSAIPLTEK